MSVHKLATTPQYFTFTNEVIETMPATLREALCLELYYPPTKPEKMWRALHFGGIPADTPFNVKDAIYCWFLATEADSFFKYDPMEAVLDYGEAHRLLDELRKRKIVSKIRDNGRVFYRLGDQPTHHYRFTFTN